MNVSRLLLTALLLLSAAPCAFAQRIVAQSSGLSSPDHLIDFGANLYPNFTPINNQFAGIQVTHARYFTTGSYLNLVGGFLTNDPIGPPDSLRIRFQSPITSVSFAYHQISNVRASNFRVLFRGSIVDAFSYLWNQTQPNNYFGFQNLVFDELQIDFVADFNFDTLAFDDLAARCDFRNGSGVNPPDYRCLTLPMLGTSWQSAISTGPQTLGSYVALAAGGPLAGLPLFGGELLIQLSPEPVFIAGTAGSFALPIPSSSWFLGGAVSVQGLRIEADSSGPRIVLLNALDLVFGT
ncbi:MAG: hypothetical protein IPN34_01275 [Planctomycetes bacterium]|nr:hypothetical protein [Planctomycetota bacterium]